jgi:hypothetical protein
VRVPARGAGYNLATFCAKYHPKRKAGTGVIACSCLDLPSTSGAHFLPHHIMRVALLAPPRRDLARSGAPVFRFVFPRYLVVPRPGITVVGLLSYTRRSGINYTADTGPVARVEPVFYTAHRHG